MRKSFRLAVHDDIDVTLPPARDGLAQMTVRGSEPQGAQHLAKLARFFFAGTEFDELDAAAGNPRIGPGTGGRAPLDLFEQIIE